MYAGLDLGMVREGHLPLWGIHQPKDILFICVIVL